MICSQSTYIPMVTPTSHLRSTIERHIICLAKLTLNIQCMGKIQSSLMDITLKLEARFNNRSPQQKSSPPFSLVNCFSAPVSIVYFLFSYSEIYQIHIWNILTMHNSASYWIKIKLSFNVVDIFELPQPFAFLVLPMAPQFSQFLECKTAPITHLTLPFYPHMKQ